MAAKYTNQKPEAPTMARPKRATADTILAGHGLRDDAREKIATVQQIAFSVANVGDDFAAQLGPKVMSAANALEDVVRVVVRLSDRAYLLLSRSRGVIEDAARAASGALPSSGWGGPEDLAAARDGATRDVRLRAEKATSEQAMGEAADDATRVSLAAQAALGDLRAAIAWATAQAVGPAGMRMSSSLDVIHREAAIESEMKSQERPMRWAYEYFAIATRNASPADLAMFIRAARSVAIQIRDTAAPKLAMRYDGKPGVGDEERETARRLLALFDQWRRDNMSPAIKLSAEALAIMIPIFRMTVGVDALTYSPARFATFMNGRIDPMSQEIAFEIAQDWPARFLQPGGRPLPGWSPIVMRTSAGGFARGPREE